MTTRSRMLRLVAVVVGLAYLLAAAVVLYTHGSNILLIYLAVAGLLVLGSVFAWRRSAARTTDSDAGYWEMTGERFRDPSTGRMMEIRRNPVTGTRDYVEVDEEA